MRTIKARGHTLRTQIPPQSARSCIRRAHEHRAACGRGPDSLVNLCVLPCSRICKTLDDPHVESWPEGCVTPVRAQRAGKDASLVISTAPANPRFLLINGGPGCESPRWVRSGQVRICRSPASDPAPSTRGCIFGLAVAETRSRALLAEERRLPSVLTSRC